VIKKLTYDITQLQFWKQFWETQADNFPEGNPYREQYLRFSKRDEQALTELILELEAYQMEELL